MKLTINGEVRDFEQPSLTVTQLLEQMGLAGRPVAIELNREIVFKRDHACTAVKDGDRLEIVTMVGGG